MPRKEYSGKTWTGLLITLAELKDIRFILEQTMDREHMISECPVELMEKINNNIRYLEGT